MPVCNKCSNLFPNRIKIDGVSKNVCNRKYCLDCSPFGVHNTRKLEEKRRSELDGLLCKKCNKPLSTSQVKGRICFSCNLAVRSDKLSDKVYAIVGHKCWLCPYDLGKAGRPMLDFHHLDRNTKRFNLDKRSVTNCKWVNVLAEMRKCISVCCRCHREVEYGIIPKGLVEDIHKYFWDKS